MSRAVITDVRPHSGQAGALVYLATRSIRNSVLLRLRRLRQPRYLLVGLALLFYVGSMTFSRSRAPLRIPDNYENVARIGTAVLFFGIMALSWVFATGAALQFTLAEIQFLFPAPITRRALLQYKIVRSLLVVSGTALFLTIFAGPRDVSAAAIIALKAWAIMAVLWLTEAGASLYKLHAKASGSARAHIRLPVLLSAFALMGLAACTLAVFAFAEGSREILRILPVMAVLLFACTVWILGSDAAFEEEAAINAEKFYEARQRIEKGQPRKATRRRSARYRLAPTGRIETAILWKNWLLFDRGSRTWMIMVAVVFVVFAVGPLLAGPSVRAKEISPFLFLIIAGFTVLMGPVMMRSDLRQNLAHLAVTKTWPVPGSAIVRGEILAPAIALSLGTAVPLIVGVLFTPTLLLPVDGSIGSRLTLLAAAGPSAVSLIVAQLVIQNGIAVTFPAWVRPKAGGGIEGMGMGMLLMYGGILLMILAALVPAAIAGIVMFLFGGVLLPGLIFAALLMLESYVATEIVGRILERTDIQDIA